MKNLHLSFTITAYYGENQHIQSSSKTLEIPVRDVEWVRKKYVNEIVEELNHYTERENEQEICELHEILSGNLLIIDIATIVIRHYNYKYEWTFTKKGGN